MPRVTARSGGAVLSSTRLTGTGAKQLAVCGRDATLRHQAKSLGEAAASIEQFSAQRYRGTAKLVHFVHKRLDLFGALSGGEQLSRCSFVNLVPT
jgi:hypothetical protein